MNTATGRVRAALDAARDTSTGAFVSLRAEQALAEAAALDAGPPRGPLHGMAFAVKDNIDVAGSWTRCGTPGLRHHLADTDATVVARLRAAGAVPIGKTRLHELAWGTTTPGCRNPHDESRTTGGSSGGSAAAVAAGVVPFALGTDTGGSVRNPAALCGVVGVKTAAGSLPMDGVAPLAPTQDTVGVFARTAAECAIVLGALGVDPGPPVHRVGVLADPWAQRLQPEVAAALATARELLHPVEVTVRHAELAAAASYVIMLAESARQWWSDDLPPGVLGAEVRHTLRLGATVTDADYQRALAVRAAVRAATEAVLADTGALLLASCPVPAAPHGATEVPCAGRSTPVEAAHTGLTALASLTGLPALSMPAPVDGLPIGLQLIGAGPLALCGLAETYRELATVSGRGTTRD